MADDMKFLIMCAMLSTAPLFGGTVVSLERKKCLPALLRALGCLSNLHHCGLPIGGTAQKNVIFEWP
jgi:hypothetical protein